MGRLQRGAGSGLVDTVFVLTLLCVLTGVALMLVALGADLYQQIAADMNRGFQLNTSLTYVANKVRRADSADGVRIGAFNGLEALILGESYDDEQYATWIYCHEGQLWELFGLVEGDFEPSDGTPLLTLSAFTFEQKQNQLILQATSEDGVQETLCLTLRSEPGRLRLPGDLAEPLAFVAEMGGGAGD